MPNTDCQSISLVRSPFIHALLPELFAHSESHPPSDERVLERLYEVAVNCATTALRGLPSLGLSPDEVVSDLMVLFLSGYPAQQFIPNKCPRAYFIGIIQRVALAHDRKHRKRKYLSLDAAHHTPESRALPPVEAASQRELIALIRMMWPKLTKRRVSAICAQLGPAFVNEVTQSYPRSKNTMAKWHGINQLRRLLEARGIREM